MHTCTTILCVYVSHFPDASLASAALTASVEAVSMIPELIALTTPKICFGPLFHNDELI
jgi:hypothetical protein